MYNSHPSLPSPPLPSPPLPSPPLPSPLPSLPPSPPLPSPPIPSPPLPSPPLPSPSPPLPSSTLLSSPLPSHHVASAVRFLLLSSVWSLLLNCLAVQGAINSFSGGQLSLDIWYHLLIGIVTEWLDARIRPKKMHHMAINEFGVSFIKVGWIVYFQAG